MTWEDKKNMIEIQLGTIQKHQSDHKKFCTVCHDVELGKTKEYCPTNEGLQYWKNALNWVLKL